ncbi:hypothetical protein [Thiobacillus denitrificans]|uniref:hypothetical protein n=1 Tax=Thiobacillus denitrificans TaxID=36861 RepID=UPI00037C1C2D|nr:hypothetical protein [Thiobacillus denitrificans]
MVKSHQVLSGAMVRRLMRKNRVSIAGLAAKNQLTRKRVREVRKNGIEGFLAEEWCCLITGKKPGCPAA